MSLFVVFLSFIAHETACKGFDQCVDPLPKDAFWRWGSTRYRSSSPLRSVAITADGTRIVAAEEQGSFHVWDQEGKTKELFHFRRLRAGTISASGKYVAVVEACDPSRKDKLWAWELGKKRPADPLAELATETVVTVRLLFSADDKYLACIDESGGLGIWEMPGTLHLEIKGAFSSDDTPVVAFSADGQLAVPSSEPGIRLFNLGSKKQTRTIQGVTDKVVGLAFGENGHLFSVAKDGFIQKWDTASGKEKDRLKATPGSLAAFSPDANLVAVCDSDDGICVVDMAQRKNMERIRGIRGGLVDLAFTADAQQIAACTEHETLRFWSIHTGREQRRANTCASRIASIISSDRNCAFASALGEICVCNMKGVGLESLQLADRIDSLAFVDSNKLIAVASEKAIILWEPRSRTPPCRLGEHQGRVYHLVSLSEPSLLVSADGTTVNLWDVKKRKKLASLQPESGVKGLSAPPDGREFAIWSRRSVEFLVSKTQTSTPDAVE